MNSLQGDLQGMEAEIKELERQLIALRATEVSTNEEVEATLLAVGRVESTLALAEQEADMLRKSISMSLNSLSGSYSELVDKPSSRSSPDESRAASRSAPGRGKTVPVNESEQPEPNSIKITPKTKEDAFLKESEDIVSPLSRQSSFTNSPVTRQIATSSSDVIISRTSLNHASSYTAPTISSTKRNSIVATAISDLTSTKHVAAPATSPSAAVRTRMTSKAFIRDEATNLLSELESAFIDLGTHSNQLSAQKNDVDELKIKLDELRKSLNSSGTATLTSDQRASIQEAKDQVAQVASLHIRGSIAGGAPNSTALSSELIELRAKLKGRESEIQSLRRDLEREKRKRADIETEYNDHISYQQDKGIQDSTRMELDLARKELTDAWNIVELGTNILQIDGGTLANALQQFLEEAQVELLNARRDVIQQKKLVASLEAIISSSAKKGGASGPLGNRKSAPPIPSMKVYGTFEPSRDLEFDDAIPDAPPATSKRRSSVAPTATPMDRQISRKESVLPDKG